ncbi:MAG: hypothetical protein ACRD9R_01830 [Pyrinomonadaceae bacterium]
MSLAGKFKKSLDEKWCMRFKCRHPDEDNFDGVITHIKSSFIVLREEDAFEFDGFVILPKKVIKGIRDGRYERCGNQIIRFNGVLRKLRAPHWLDSCETIPQVFASMMRRDIWPAVEIVFNEERESALYLGPITNLNDEQFSLKCYDAAGKWEKTYKLSYDEIFKIEFDSSYCKHFNAYMKSSRIT